MTDVAQVTVPPFKVELSPAEIDQAMGYFREILESGWLILGRFTKSLEERFAELAGARHGIAVNSGSSALEIIFRALGVGPGKDVLVPTNTNFATAAAAMYSGARVELFDGGLYPDFEDLERRITDRTAVVVVVHIGGYMSGDLPRIRDLCKERGIAFVEDAAHAHHAELGGARAGTFGDAAAFSFYPTKVMTTGEGGMILTDNADLETSTRCFRDQGKDKTGLRHVVMGNSWRLTELGAAFGLVQVEQLDRDTCFRQQVMERFENELGSVLEFPAMPADMKPSGYKSVALLPTDRDREAYYAELKEHGVMMGRPVYELPLHRQPVFQQAAVGSYPEADDFCDRHICLPLWRFISEEQQEQVIGAIKTVG